MPIRAYIYNRGMSKRSPYRRRGPDKRPRTMSPNSLANLRPVTIPAVLDGRESVPVRVRLTPADARTLRRLDPDERSRVVEMGLRARENGG